VQRVEGTNSFFLLIMASSAAENIIEMDQFNLLRKTATKREEECEASYGAK